MKRLVTALREGVSALRSLRIESESQRLLLGRLLAEAVRAKPRIESFREVEFSVFSQWGDDGIIQWLIHRLGVTQRSFVEFGVQDYRESTTRFLMMNDGWSGVVMDGDPAQVERIVRSEYFWRHDLRAIAAFVDAENIDRLLRDAGAPRDLGLLHIDIDGNDYWVWNAIESVEPVIAIVEYNAVFGAERPIAVPYDPSFVRTRAHESNLYWGASLPALVHLGRRKGYAFVGCNSAGNNAYFVRRDRLVGGVTEVELPRGFVDSRFRESRDRSGALTHLAGAARLECIRGLPVVEVTSGRRETL